MLAFGKVDLFLPVIRRVLAAAQSLGGVLPMVAAPVEARAEALHGIAYRWFRTADLVALLTVCGRVVEDGGLGRIFRAGPARECLGGAITTLRTHAADAARFSAVGPAFPSLFPHPEAGSACKRWLMLLRWMVRRTEPDLGLWTHLDPAQLVIPCDTHVGRVGRMLGLTHRASDDWRTAVEITAALARLDPQDPTRYDFALAHLGISGDCRGYRIPEVCPSCPLEPLCEAPLVRDSRRRSR